MWPFALEARTIAIFIPIIVVLGVFVTVVVAIIMQNKQKELEHKERMIAMEKGITIPEPPKPKRKPRYLALRTWGIVLLGIGIAVVFGITGEAGLRHGLWGLIPVLMGVGLIISSALEKKDFERMEKEERSMNR